MQFEEFNITKELHNLGEFDPRWEGIFSPIYEDDFVQKFIHRQFIEDASVYIQKYQNLEYWQYLLQSAQQFFTFKSDDRLRILDLGSGSGNTVFPLMELYPNAHIIASDLSIPLLKSLKEYYDIHYKGHPCAILQLNAEDMIFEPNTIDLIVGGAILHHLFDPSKTLEQCYKVLKPGGIALFFEPFEIGYLIISMVLNQLIDLNEKMLSPILLTKLMRKLGLSPFWNKEIISPEIIAFFKALCLDFEVRKGIDKGRPIYQSVDDKWLFTKGYFEKISQTLGFNALIIYPLHEVNNQFSNQIKSFLQIGLGKSDNSLPKWALDYIEKIDKHFSKELLEEFIIEGGIVLRK